VGDAHLRLGRQAGRCCKSGGFVGSVYHCRGFWWDTVVRGSLDVQLQVVVIASH
jgi:hypothetical protein